MPPQIFIVQNGKTKIIIDTKWKQVEQNKPAINDLRQMYVYNDHWKSKIAILLYPGSEADEPLYQKYHFPDHSCGVLKMNVLDEYGALDLEMGERLLMALEREGFILHALLTLDYPGNVEEQ